MIAKQESSAIQQDNLADLLGKDYNTAMVEARRYAHIHQPYELITGALSFDREHPKGDYTVTVLPNIGVVSRRFTDEELKPIKDEVQELIDSDFKGEFHGTGLVGQIRKEFTLIKSWDHIENLLMPYAMSMIADNVSLQQGLQRSSRPDAHLRLESVWVNYQEPGEYNPPHNHSGLLSFVIWIDVPYYSVDERYSDKSPGINSSTNEGGMFKFIYTDVLGHLSHVPLNIDAKANNLMAMFPASLNHMVCPYYTSDKRRISVAGNFFWGSKSDLSYKDFRDKRNQEIENMKKELDEFQKP